MEEFRCSKCGKKLGEIEGKAIIKCPRCKEICYCDMPKPYYVAGSIENNTGNYANVASPITRENFKEMEKILNKRLQGGIIER